MSNEPFEPQLRLSLAGIILITTATAVVLWLARFLGEYGGVVRAIIVCAVPFSIVVEFAFGQRAKWESIGWRSVVGRVCLLLVCSLVPALATQMGMWKEMYWWSPLPCLTVTWVFWIYEYLDYFGYAVYAIFAVPAVVYFVTLSAPIIANKSLAYLPMRSLVMLLIATMTSVYWFGSGFSYRYQSQYYITMSIISNTIVIIALWTTWFFLRRRFSTSRIILWNMALVSWLFWIAHPWIGEYL